MKGIKPFEEFLKLNIVKKQSPEKSRAEFLIKESEQTYNYLLLSIEKIGINKDSANSLIKNSYDVIMELIRAKMLLQGFNATGNGAYEAEVSYMRILNFTENDIRFADQIRFFRNGMLYY